MRTVQDLHRLRILRGSEHLAADIQRQLSTHGFAAVLIAPLTGCWRVRWVEDELLNRSGHTAELAAQHAAGALGAADVVEMDLRGEEWDGLKGFDVFFPRPGGAE